MNLDNFKTSLGIGYRPNLWDIKFTFKNDNTLIDTIDEELSKYTSTLPDANSVGKQFIFLNNKKEFSGLITKFQLPGYTLTESESIFRFKNYPTTATKGGLGNIDILMDENNIQYMFFKILLSYMNNATFLEYPSNYLFDITFNIISAQAKENEDRKSFLKYNFYNCYVISIGDINHVRTETTSIPTFSIGINYEDYDYTNVETLYKNTEDPVPVPLATTEKTKRQYKSYISEYDEYGRKQRDPATIPPTPEPNP